MRSPVSSDSQSWVYDLFFLGIYRILSLTFQNIALWCLSDDELFWVLSGGGGGLVAKLCPTLCNPGLKPARVLCLWNSSGKNTGVGCHALLQGTFPTQGSDSCLLPWQVDSLPLSHQGSPKTKMGLVNEGLHYRVIRSTLGIFRSFLLSFS